MHSLGLGPTEEHSLRNEDSGPPTEAVRINEVVFIQYLNNIK